MVVLREQLNVEAESNKRIFIENLLNERFEQKNKPEKSRRTI